MKHSLGPLIKALTPLIRGICFYQSDVTVKELEEKGCMVLVVTPHMADVPKLVGRSGRQSKALNFLCEQYGRQHGFAGGSRIEESYVGVRAVSSTPPEDPAFDQTGVLAIVNELMSLLLSRRAEVTTEPKDDRLCVYVHLTPFHTLVDGNIVNAVEDLMYPYGKANGRKIKVKVPSDETVTP